MTFCTIALIIYAVATLLAGWIAIACCHAGKRADEHFEKLWDRERGE